MEIDIKKKLVKNWFKTLQDMVCFEIEEIENNKKNERIILITTKAIQSYSEFSFKIDDTLLFGRESAGVPKKIHEIVDEKFNVCRNSFKLCCM